MTRPSQSLQAELSVDGSQAVGRWRSLHFVILTVLLFGLIYNISFLAAPSVTTGRLAVIALVCLVGSRGAVEVRSRLREHWSATAILSVVGLYSFVVYVSSGNADFSQVSRLLHLALLTAAGAALFVVAVDFGRLRFLGLFVTATVVQSFLIAYSFGSASYRLWLSGMLVQGGNIPLATALQAPGFSNSSGANLSLIQGLGVFAALLGARLASTRVQRMGFWVAAFVNALSTMVVGRTGLQFAAASMLLFAFTGGPRALIKLGIVGGLAAVLLGLSWGRAVDALTEINPSAPATMDWAFNVFRQRTKEPAIQELIRQGAPALGIETMLGTGLVAGGLGGGNASGSDSGYLQTYYALGLPMAIVFYLTVMGVFARLWASSDHRAIMAGLLALMFVVELKEPFLLKYVYPFFALALLWLSQPSVAGRKTDRMPAVNSVSAGPDSVLGRPGGRE